MGILRHVPLPPAQRFCLCIPPFYLNTGIGTIWQCDSCGRVYERVAGSPAWKRIEYPVDVAAGSR